jgi:TonB family protein
MSTAVAPALSRQYATARKLSRHTAAVSLDLVVLRSGIPDRIPGRSLNVSEGGVGLVSAGELFAGESVGLELFFPGMSLPIRARAVVRHQGPALRSGVELVGLSVQQREMLRSWLQQLDQQSRESVGTSTAEERNPAKLPMASTSKVRRRARRIPGHVVRIAVLSLAVVSLGWWRWQRGWNEIEAQLPADKAASVQPQVIVPATVMEQRLRHKVDPAYPEEARGEGLQSIVVLHAFIGADGSVIRVEPVSGPEVLAMAAMDAVRWWRYEPYLVNGRPAEVETTVQVQFIPPAVSMNRKESR